MGNYRRWTLIFFTCFLIFLSCAQAQAPKITIKAEKIEYSLKEQITRSYGTAEKPVLVTYNDWELAGSQVLWDEKADLVVVEGRVKVVRKDETPLVITCSQLRFWPRSERFEATGSVVVERGEVKATAGLLTGNGKEIVLTEKPLLLQEGQRISGKSITFSTSQEKILVEDAFVEVEAGER